MDSYLDYQLTWLLEKSFYNNNNNNNNNNNKTKTTNNTQQQQTTTNNKHETGKTYASFNSLVYQENIQNMQRDNLLYPLTTQGTQLWNEKQ